jgi:signal transduction histidine kinase
MSLVLLLSGLAVYMMLRRGLVKHLDDSLLREARVLLSTVEQERDGLDIEFDDLRMEEFANPSGPGYLQLVANDGESLYRSPSLGLGTLPRIGKGHQPGCRWIKHGDSTLRILEIGFYPHQDPEVTEGRRVSLQQLPKPARDAILDAANGSTSIRLLIEKEEEGQQLIKACWHDGDRLREIEVAPDGNVLSSESRIWIPGRAEEGADPARIGLTLLLAREASSVQSTLALAKVSLLAVGTMAMAVTAAVLWFAVRRSLRSAETLASEIEAVEPETLSLTLKSEQVPSELTPIVSKLNGLLHRLAKAMQREKEFSSDVAHELRTPLAALRTAMEVATVRKRSAEDHEETLALCLSRVYRMQEMIEGLLLLSRLEAGQSTLHPEQVDIKDALHHVWTSLADLAHHRDLHVQWDAHCGGVVTDRALLETIFRNILGNAVSHANQGGTVIVRALSRDEARVRIIVSNTGNTVPPAKMSMVFERLWRGDSARSGQSVHAGLGLAIVRRAVDAIGGTVTACRQEGGWFRVEVVVRNLPEANVASSRQGKADGKGKAPA